MSSTGVPVQTTLGRSGGSPDGAAAALTGYAVVHLHGAMTYATSDGWTENLIAPGQWALDTYPNDQRRETSRRPTRARR